MVDQKLQHVDIDWIYGDENLRTCSLEFEMGTLTDGVQHKPEIKPTRGVDGERQNNVLKIQLDEYNGMLKQ